MIDDPFIGRLRNKARSNQLCIAVGSAYSGSMSIPSLAKALLSHFNINFIVGNDYEWYTKWNEFIYEVERSVGREKLIEYTVEKIEEHTVQPIYRKIAAIPISNFIDTSIENSLYKSHKEINKQPILGLSYHMGGWAQSNPTSPTVFSAFDLISNFSSNQLLSSGLNLQFTYSPNDRLQLLNMMDMLDQKDLLLLGMSPHEAEDILQLATLAQAADKIINTEDPTNNHQYWTKRGVYIADIPTEDVIEELLPHDMKSYTFWDAPFPQKKLVDIMKQKEFDGFISYFSGDSGFSKNIARDLKNRGVNIWIDDEIDIGDSISDKIQIALETSYTFIIVLSPESLGRPWVKEELRAAYNLRLAEDLKILPVMYKDCKLPLFLSDYHYADFREEGNYTEQINLLSRSIGNAVKRARNKK